MYMNTRAQGFGPEVKRRIMLGTYALSSGYYDAYYKKAQQVRTLIKKDFEKAFRKVDLIVTPTTPTPAFRIGEKTDDPLQMYLADIFTIIVNLAGVPAISIPCGFTSGNLPVGLQLIGRHFDEEAVLKVAYAYEQSTDWHTRRPVRMKYEAVIGLEVHAQMLTETKIFCGCSTTFGSEPNTQTCPVCIGMPGVLPVLNRKALEYAIRTGLATGCSISLVQPVCQKKLFLPRPSEGVSDKPVRASDMRAWTYRHRCRR